VDERTAESLLGVAERAAPALRGVDGGAVLDGLDSRYDELLSALRWFVDQERVDESLRLARSLALFWQATKRLDEGVVWFDRALGLQGGGDSNRGHALFHAGLLAFWQGDDDGAAERHRAALDVGRRAGDATVVALALGGLARIALRTDVEEARRLCREALAVTDGTGDRAGRSGAVHVLAVAAQMAGDLLEARELMSQRLELGREDGNFAVVSSEAGNLSMVERQLGNLDRAEELARESLEIDERRGDFWSMPYKLSGLAAVAVERGEHEYAATLVGAAETMMRDEGADWPPDERPHYERTVAVLRDALGPEGFEETRSRGAALSTREAVDYALRR
jgi:tetratricopeptide (TPR) repeat protein